MRARDEAKVCFLSGSRYGISKNAARLGWSRGSGSAPARPSKASEDWRLAASARALRAHLGALGIAVRPAARSVWNGTKLDFQGRAGAPVGAASSPGLALLPASARQRPHSAFELRPPHLPIVPGSALSGHRKRAGDARAHPRSSSWTGWPGPGEARVFRDDTATCRCPAKRPIAFDRAERPMSANGVRFPAPDQCPETPVTFGYPLITNPLALTDRRVTPDSGHMGNTAGLCGGFARRRGRSVPKWTNDFELWRGYSTGRSGHHTEKKRPRHGAEVERPLRPTLPG